MMLCGQLCGARRPGHSAVGAMGMRLMMSHGSGRVGDWVRVCAGLRAQGGIGY